MSPDDWMLFNAATVQNIHLTKIGANRVVVSVGDEVPTDDLSPDLVYVDLVPVLD